MAARQAKKAGQRETLEGASVERREGEEGEEGSGLERVMVESEPNRWQKFGLLNFAHA